MQVEPTSFCNLACPLCPAGRNELDRERRNMTFNEFKSIVDDLEDYLLFLILWDWGEPLMNPDLPAMIRYANYRGIKTVTSTNGQFLESEAYLVDLLKSGLTTLIVAIDSIHEESYQTYRKKGSLDKALNGLKNLIYLKKKLNSPTTINMRTVVMKHNESEVDETREIAKQLGVDIFTVKTANPSCGSTAADDGSVPDNAEFRRYEYIDGTYQRVRVDSMCSRVWTVSNIFSNGDIVPCCYDYNSEMKVGNIREQKFTELWNSHAYRELRKKIYFDKDSIIKCRECGVNFKLSSSGWFVESYRWMNQANAGIRNEPVLKSLIRALNLPLEEDKQTGWKPYPLFSGSTHFTDSFSSHVSVLSPGVIPHQPHSHVEEELLIMLSGEACLVIPDMESNGTETMTKIYPGSFVYYPAFKRHTIYNTGPVPATYLMFKWHKDSALKADCGLKTTILRYDDGPTSVDPKPAQEVAFKEILYEPTAYLSKLQCHVTTLQQGSGYQPHIDPYDVAILLLKGTVETLGQIVEARSVMFYATGEPHGMINCGQNDAFYLVFEFHGKEPNVTGQDKRPEIITSQNQKIAEMEETISELNKQNAVLIAKLQNMERSISWHMTMMFHNGIVERFFPQGSWRRNSYTLTIDAGRILINEGPDAFWRKFKEQFKI
jgi:radical SAM protein with 4Fe4S-binding SPASM domain